MVAVLAACIAAACASTKITSTWRDPAIGPVQFRKVVGIALSRDTTLRRLAEDEFVRAVGPGTAIAGYAVVDDSELQDKALVKQRVEAAHADGVVVFRLVGIDQQQRWVPPTTYGNTWGYWGYAAPLVYDPGYLVTDNIVQIETNAWDVGTARLVWSARSETFNPKDTKSLVTGVVDAAVTAMRKENLIPQPGGSSP
jgi:hypothetical protein